MRLTVLGTGTARPWPDTAASGLLVETATTAVLFDCGSGIASKLEAIGCGAAGLNGIVVGHLHADHWIDLAPLRYRFPWGEMAPNPLPVRLPPGARPKVDALAVAISERAGFFDAQFDIVEYVDRETFHIGDLTITPQATGHYVPAWSMSITGPDGERMVYAGDMGPSESVVELARGAQLLVLESTLEDNRFDDVRRGHITPEEAIEHVQKADVGRGLLVHYPSERREVIREICASLDPRVTPAVTGTRVEITPDGVTDLPSRHL